MHVKLKIHNTILKWINVMLVWRVNVFMTKKYNIHKLLRHRINQFMCCNSDKIQISLSIMAHLFQAKKLVKQKTKYSKVVRIIPLCRGIKLIFLFQTDNSVYFVPIFTILVALSIKRKCTLGFGYCPFKR